MAEQLPRLIEVTLLLEGGHSETVEIAENASELLELFQVLSCRGTEAEGAYREAVPATGGGW